jgi:3-deoxy-D-manno-octulosonate 8-phosphate phosphatase KdsC-like HAD superfamily phosphatase
MPPILSWLLGNRVIDKQSWRSIRAIVIYAGGVFTAPRIGLIERKDGLDQVQFRDLLSGEFLNEWLRAIPVPDPIKVLIVEGRPGLTSYVVQKFEGVSFLAGGSDKETATMAWLQDQQIDPKTVLFIGDGGRDMRTMSRMGFVACPGNAPDFMRTYVRRRSGYITSRHGGEGALAEIGEYLVTQVWGVDLAAGYLTHGEQWLDPDMKSDLGRPQP